VLDDRGWERDELSVYQGREEAADGSADWAEHSGRTLVEMSCTRASAAAVAIYNRRLYAPAAYTTWNKRNASGVSNF
jgi:hypothetical protein